MKRESREISEKDVYLYASEYDSLVGMEFTVESCECESSDTEDGGGHYRKILKEVSTEKYFQLYYSDWDIENTDFNWETNDMYENGRCDLSTTLTEVFPQQVVKLEFT